MYLEQALLKLENVCCHSLEVCLSRVLNARPLERISWNVGISWSFKKTNSKRKLNDTGRCVDSPVKSKLNVKFYY